MTDAATIQRKAIPRLADGSRSWPAIPLRRDGNLAWWSDAESSVNWR
jgi:hypothetical protein